ncbi:eukaryotic porin [Sporormia fimetaria CBS 119925]|uniref:Eukaryotic porin n=1 Tax=Sporormia fimetaria CBS 119925 TaxID=1340428 RepID=A0A6A6V0F9_9PLEO|nr:eukaryotic porin [Sporormia fimetaria CBS 119925]
MELDAKPKAAYADVLAHNSFVGRIRDVYAAFHERREALGLTNPGTVENIAKEVQRDVFLNNLSFTGLRADLTKAFSVAPLFQVSHAISMGSQAQPPYTYGVLYGSPKMFLQGNLDNDLQFSGRFNWRWASNFVTKTSVQLTSQANMVSIENDYTGADFSASLKTVNPSILDGGVTGMVMASYLQSITPRLALGLEAFWSRPAMAYPPSLNVSYAMRYKTPEWMASLNMVAGSALEASYWRKLSDKVEAGINMNLAMSQASPLGPAGKEGTVTIGAKYDFRASSFRAQIDNQGKVSCLLEKVILPPVRVTFSGEIDHKANDAKVGLAVSIESADEEVMQQQEMAAAVQTDPIPF